MRQSRKHKDISFLYDRHDSYNADPFYSEERLIKGDETRISRGING